MSARPVQQFFAEADWRAGTAPRMVRGHGSGKSGGETGRKAVGFAEACRIKKRKPVGFVGLCRMEGEGRSTEKANNGRMCRKIINKHMDLQKVGRREFDKSVHGSSTAVQAAERYTVLREDGRSAC